MSELNDFIKKTEAEYTIKNGVIQNPGKFEGESIAALWFYEGMLNGDCDSDCIAITRDEGALFGIEDSIKYVKVNESESGFVSLEYLTEEEYYSLSFANEEESEEEE